MTLTDMKTLIFKGTVDEINVGALESRNADWRDENRRFAKYD